jgi:uncharacterized hydrophobic protein (TIGR00271 family)
MRNFENIRKLLKYVDLESEIDDYDKIHQTIEKDIIFKGTNLWILVFAIIIASVGLNMNSTAVIIGAMLVSPLMGPINGIGYSIATYNFLLFRKSVKNLSFAVLASLIASTTYFAISPISTAHSELLARTSPSIYDVLIALFGGLAGIVAISSKQKGNVIPGVAIATALMPPLCTSGYGLATGQFTYFFGAFYLFTINAVFIAISSVVISQILGFPIRTIVESEQKKKVNQLITFVISIVLIPSIYFGYVLVQNEKFTENATRYINNISVVEGNYLLKHEIDANKKSITLVYGGTSLTELQKEEIRRKALDFSLDGAEIALQQGFSFDEVNKRTSMMEDMKAEVNRLSLQLRERDKQLDSVYQKNFVGKEILDELKSIYPQVQTCSFSESFFFQDTLLTYQPAKVVVLGVKDMKQLGGNEQKKIESWLKIRLKTNEVRLFFDPI